MKSTSGQPPLDASHELLYELNHNELIPFVQRNLKNLNLVTVTYYSLNFLLLLWMAAEIGMSAGKKTDWTGILLGFAPAFLLVPLHEWIHGVIYKVLGAPDVGYTANWRKFYFTAQADKFVINERQFYLVAFAPITVISLLLLAAMFFAPQLWYLALIGTLFVHTAMCSGDFGIASFMYEHRRDSVVTYDDFHQGRSFFLIRKKQRD